MTQNTFPEVFKTKKSKITSHVVFWVVFFIYLIWDAYFENTLLIVMFDSLIYLAITAVLVYTNILFLVPKFLYKRKYFTYIVLFLFLLFAGSGSKQYAYTFIIPAADAHEYSITYMFFNWFFRTLFEVAAISSIQIFQDWVYTKENLQKVEKERLEAELKFLKAQVNPHFLFNTLNNIFFLIKKNPDKATNSVLKLSEMLRFRLYETNGHKISVQKEIEYIRNYINLETLRNEDKLSVNFSAEGEHIIHDIEPFIFLDFVENAFKHNTATIEQKGSITIKFNITDHQISFLIENTINKIAQQENENENSKGIGLPNIRKRLELMYPQKHLLVIQKKFNTFIVQLDIKT